MTDTTGTTSSTSQPTPQPTPQPILAPNHGNRNLAATIFLDKAEKDAQFFSRITGSEISVLAWVDWHADLQTNVTRYRAGRMPWPDERVVKTFVDGVEQVRQVELADTTTTTTTTTATILGNLSGNPSLSGNPPLLPNLLTYSCGHTYPTTEPSHTYSHQCAECFREGSKGKCW